MQVELHSYLELSDDFSIKAPYVIVGMGVFVLLIGVMACCCTVHGQPSLLYLVTLLELIHCVPFGISWTLPYHVQYGGFLVLVFLLEIVLTASIYAYRERLTHGFDRGLNSSLMNYGQDVIRTADFDVMQAKLECCGSRGYQDWDALNPPQPVPRSCCLQLANCDVENPDDIYNMVGFEPANYPKILQRPNEFPNRSSRAVMKRSSNTLNRTCRLLEPPRWAPRSSRLSAFCWLFVWHATSTRPNTSKWTDSKGLSWRKRHSAEVWKRDESSRISVSVHIRRYPCSVSLSVVPTQNVFAHL